MYQELRFRHHWIFGQTGTGKTTLLIQSALEDIEHGDGVIFIDAYQNNSLLEQIPKRRHKDLVIFDLADIEYPIAWNPLETGDAHTAAVITETLRAIWGYADASTPQLDQILYNAAVAMIDQPDGTFLGMLFLLTNPAYRLRVTKDIKDPVVKAFWEDFSDLAAKDQRELTRSTLNKIQMLVADPRLRNILAQPKSNLNISDIIKHQKILVVRLPLQSFGEQKVAAIGAMLLSQVALHMHENTKPFHIHIDNLQYFQTPLVKTLLAVAGHYQVSLTFTNQYLAQLRPDLLNACIGNTGRKTAFRTGITDGRILADEFYTDNITFPLYELPPYQARVVSPAGAKEFTLHESDYEPVDSPDRLFKLSRRAYASQRTQTEPKINKFMESMS